MWHFSKLALASLILSSVNFSEVDSLPTISKPSATLQNAEVSPLQRGADIQEFLVDETTEGILLSVLPQIKDAVAERVSTYAVFIHEDHVFNLLWAIPKLKFTALSYKAEVTNGIGMTYYVKYKVGLQCFQVKVFKNFDGDVIKVQDVIGAIKCDFPVIFF